MNRRRSRVSPSSSTVTFIGPRATVATSTSTTFGDSDIHTTPATMTAITTHQRYRFIRLLSNFENANEIEAVDASPHDQPRDDRRYRHYCHCKEPRPRRHDERKPVELAIRRPDDQSAQALPKNEADRQRANDNHRQLAQQNRRHLASCEPEHT